jgi:predicted amidohydrolase YtcJ
VIVAATLVAGLIVGAQRDEANGPIDLIIVNGKVYPGGGAPVQEAVAVRGNQILRVGSNRDVKRLRRPQTVVLDAHGATVLPGFNDAHVQLIAGALSLQHVDLSSAATLDDIEAVVSAYAADAPTQPWILGRNGDPTLFAATNIAARKILDDNVADRPVLLTSEDGTVAWANSEALRRAGIDRHTRVQPAGAIVRNRRTGEPTGVLKAAALDLMTRVLPQATHAEKLVALHSAIEEAHRLGVTSIQTVSATDEELRLLKEIREQGDLGIRVSGSVAVSETVDESAIAELDKLRIAYPDDPTLKIGGVEISCPCNAPKLERAVALLDKHNWHVMVRAASQPDVHAALDAFEHAAAANPAPARGRRFRLEDVEDIDTEDLARLTQLGAIADPFEADVSRAAPLWSALSEAGARILFGSNWPTSSFDPRDAVEDTVTDQPDALPAVLDAYTAQSAYASYDEGRKGTLAPGMLADIVVLSNDIFRNPAQSLKETAVTVTIFDGKVVYQRPAPTASN